MPPSNIIQATLPGSECYICDGVTWQLSKQVSEKPFSVHTDITVTCVSCHYTELRHFEFHQFEMLAAFAQHVRRISATMPKIVRTSIAATLRQFASTAASKSAPVQHIRLL